MSYLCLVTTTYNTRRMPNFYALHIIACAVMMLSKISRISSLGTENSSQGFLDSSHTDYH